MTSVGVGDRGGVESQRSDSRRRSVKWKDNQGKKDDTNLRTVALVGVRCKSTKLDPGNKNEGDGDSLPGYCW